MIYTLASILVVVLVAPFVSKRVEKNIEAFFLVMGIVASLVSGSFGLPLLLEAFKAPLTVHGIPVGIFQVVLIAGILFERYRASVRRALSGSPIPGPVLFSAMVFLTGIGSSVISAISASAVVAEILRTMGVPRRARAGLAVAAAYSIGIGAALTPLGEPLSTIVVQKLSGPPHNADFFFLARILWDYVLAGVVASSLVAYFSYSRALSVEKTVEAALDDDEEHLGSYREAVIRSFKIFVFVFALVLLGHSFDPLVERYVVHMQPWILYLFGSISAAVDNAALTAAIVSPEMEIAKIKPFLVSLLIAGGFLIPGNVPNIVLAEVNKVSFREWALKALPIGVPMFFAAFLGLFILGL